MRGERTTTSRRRWHGGPGTGPTGEDGPDSPGKLPLRGTPETRSSEIKRRKEPRAKDKRQAGNAEMDPLPIRPTLVRGHFWLLALDPSGSLPLGFPPFLSGSSLRPTLQDPLTLASESEWPRPEEPDPDDRRQRRPAPHPAAGDALRRPRTRIDGLQHAPRTAAQPNEFRALQTTKNHRGGRAAHAPRTPPRPTVPMSKTRDSLVIGHACPVLLWTDERVHGHPSGRARRRKFPEGERRGGRPERTDPP
jgi:hypothetical protein